MGIPEVPTGLSALLLYFAYFKEDNMSFGGEQVEWFHEGSWRVEWGMSKIKTLYTFMKFLKKREVKINLK